MLFKIAKSNHSSGTPPSQRALTDTLLGTATTLEGAEHKLRNLAQTHGRGDIYIEDPDGNRHQLTPQGHLRCNAPAD